MPHQRTGVKSMSVTISTHNGSAVAREHNIRNPKVVSKEPHIQPDGKFEIWHDEKPQAAYQRIFGQALEEYNNKQKRADRKIQDYYRHICNDKKKHPVYEMIVAIGNRNNTVDDETGYFVLRAFYDGWKERNPRLELIGAYYHADEDGVPHVHIDYIPVATGYVNGMSTQSALVKAFGQQEFFKDGKETAQIKWERRENAELERLCRQANIEVEHPLIEGRKHLDTERYKFQAQVQADIQEMERKRKNAQHQTDLAEEQERIAKQKAQEEQDNLDWQREETENLILSVDRLKREEQQLQDKIDKLQERLKKLKGEVLTAEQVKDIEIKKAPLGMALLKYKDAVDLKKTAERVKSADEVINDKWEILSSARKRATEIIDEATKKSEKTEHLLNLRLSEISSLEKSICTLADSKHIAQRLPEEEKKKGIDREKVLKNADTIRKNYEQNEQQNLSEQSQSQTTSYRGRR